MADEDCNLDAQVTNMEMTEHIIISNKKRSIHNTIVAQYFHHSSSDILNQVNI